MSYIRHRSNDFTKEQLDYENYSEDLDHATRNESRDDRRKLLLQFASSLATQMRGIKFAHKDYRSLFVFMEGELMCMGWIGYGDYQVTTTPDDLSYVVYSRHIDNQKYSFDSEQHYMKQSINESTAIKNCKKYLRNYNTIEMADLDLSKVKASATKKVVKMSNDAESEIGKVLDVNRYRPQNSPLFNTMRHVLNSGIELPDKEFKDKLVNMFKVYDEFLANKGNKVSMMYVKVYERLGKRSFDVCELGRVATGANEERSLNYHALKEKTLTKYDDDTLPEYVLGKISVLSMIDKGTYVDDVGYRGSVDNTFYIVCDENLRGVVDA